MDMKRETLLRKQQMGKEVLLVGLVGLLVNVVIILILKTEASSDHSFLNDYGVAASVLLLTLLLFAVLVLVSFAMVKITERRLYSGRP